MHVIQQVVQNSKMEPQSQSHLPWQIAWHNDTFHLENHGYENPYNTALKMLFEVVVYFLHQDSMFPQYL